MSCNRAVLLDSFLSRLVLCLSLLLTISVAPLWAQSTSTGSLFGQVTDPTGASVVGATVTMTDTSTGIARTVTSNETGRYIFVNVTPGKYDLSITKRGFAAVKMAGQTVEVGKTVAVDVTLRVGATTEVVEVQANGVELQTTNATVGNTVTGVALDSLPSLGRDVSTFVTLQPGISPDGSVAGTVVDQSSFQLDGGNNTNDMDGSMSVYTPSFAGDPDGWRCQSERRSGRWTDGRYADASRQRGGVQGQYRQPERRLQQLVRRAGAGGHQTRHQCLARNGVRVLSG